MSKAQMIVAEIVFNVEDGEYKDVVKKGLMMANLVSLEFIQQQMKATITQQNKQINKQTNKNEMKRNEMYVVMAIPFSQHKQCHTISSSVSWHEFQVQVIQILPKWQLY